MTPVARPPTTSGTKSADLIGSPLENIRIAVTLGHLRRALVDHQRLPRLHHVLAEADQRDRLLIETLAALDHIGEVEKSARLVVDRDAHDLSVEDLLQPVADEVVDRLRVELAGDRRLDAVDQCQLGVSLPRLVDELSVLERDTPRLPAIVAATAGRSPERVPPVEVLHRDPAAGLVPEDERWRSRTAGAGSPTTASGVRTHRVPRPCSARVDQNGSLVSSSALAVSRPLGTPWEADAALDRHTGKR